MARRMTACNDTYVRNEEGVWCYYWGELVPGATDLTLSHLMGIDPNGSTDLLGEYRSLNSEELRWMAGRRPNMDKVIVRPTPNRKPRAGDLVVGVHAPELNVHAMLTVADLAYEASVSKPTIDSYRSRGYVPEPQALMGRTPLWARPIIRRWLAARPGPGWRSDIKAADGGVST